MTRALDRKVLRDLRLLWTQAVTIALVVASGAGGFLASLSAVGSLAAARDDFYASAHFADVFASVKRAPASMTAQLAAIPGVADVQTTVEAFARINVPSSTDPVMGNLIGYDARRPHRLNQVLLRSGQWAQPHSGGDVLEAVVTEAFAEAHNLRPGSVLGALVNGKRRTLLVTGTALSPEYIFGGLFGMPDKRAFGVFWVDREELSGAMDMRGAFNRVAVKLAPDGAADAVSDALDRRLAPLGGQPAHGREEQPSNAMLDNEIREQQVLGTVLPSIFLLVAGFLLHIVTARLVATQREQIAALKALGYRNTTIALHYLKLVAPMVLAGWALGVLLGDRLGSLITGLYAEFFRFPVFVHRIPPDLAIVALGMVLLTGVAGTLTAISATVRLAPAEAMRPAAPGHYRRSLIERLPRLRLSAATGMILRNIERRPLRAAMTTGGIAAAVAIVMLGNFFSDAMDVIVDTQFNLSMRADLVVWTTDVVQAGAVRELARLPGVQQAEPGRRIAVRFSHGPYTHTGMVDGYDPGALLQRVFDVEGRRATPGMAGLLMTDRLAERLHLQPGDWVDMEVREGRREVRRVRLERTVANMMGLFAWMEREPLVRLLGESDTANFFSLKVRADALPAVLTATQSMPRVAGAFSKATMVRNMEEISARNVRIMSGILTVFATVIAVGVVYNNARIALAERAWELASLRVLGFTRAEVSRLLLGEMAWTIALAVPLGIALGWALTHAVIGLMRSDQFQFPVAITAATCAWAALAVVGAGIASALVVRRRIDRLDMVSALKTRE